MAEKKKTTTKKTTTKKPAVKLRTYNRKDKHEFKQAYCEKVARLGARGMGKFEIIKELGIYRDLFEKWVDEIPEFKEAMEMSHDNCRAWWERMGRHYIKPPKNQRGINTVLWIFNMKNRFNWRDKSEIQSNEKQQTSLKIDLSDVSDSQLDSLGSLPIKNIREKLKLVKGKSNGPE